jgi:hypothetical protein
MFGVERDLFVDCWVSPADSRSLGIVQGDTMLTMLGYGVLRKCRAGYKIGPLFADGPDLAESPFLSMTAGVPEGAGHSRGQFGSGSDGSELWNGKNVRNALCSTQLERGDPKPPMKRHLKFAVGVHPCRFDPNCGSRPITAIP